MTAGGEGRTDPRERFSGAARAYARFRPGYPDALVDRVLSEAGVKSRDPVADLGCGTGILTRMLAARGLDVLGIALVTVAQAFHWCDVDAALGELRRVLNPQGHVAAIWNIRGENAFMDAYDALLRRFSSEYKVLESWETTLAELKPHARVVDARELRAEHAQRFDLEGLQGRAWSSSYVFRGVEDQEGFDQALASLFDGHAQDGAIEFPYRCVGLVFKLRTSEP